MTSGVKERAVYLSSFIFGCKCSFVRWTRRLGPSRHLVGEEVHG